MIAIVSGRLAGTSNALATSRRRTITTSWFSVCLMLRSSWSTSAQSSRLTRVCSIAFPGSRLPRFAFDFLTAEDFRIKARSIALGWLTVLCGHSFHVRMHRRGLKSELPSPSVEQFLDDAILTAASERGAPSRIDFSDPDYVIDGTVGNRAGLTLWSRNDLRRLPFLCVSMKRRASCHFSD